MKIIALVFAASLGGGFLALFSMMYLRRQPIEGYDDDGDYL